MLQSVRTPKKIDKILPLDSYRGLKPSAKRVYCFVWNGAIWKQNPVWIDDVYIASRTNVPLHALFEIRDDLAASGLLRIAPDAAGCTYTITDPYRRNLTQTN